MAVVFEGVSLLVLGTDDESEALEELTNLLPRFVLAQIQEAHGTLADTPDGIREFHMAHDYGYIGPFDDGDMLTDIREGRENFGEGS